MKIFTFKNIRVFILLCILAYAYHFTHEQELSATYWYKPVTATIFPINGDQTSETSKYISNLTITDFTEIDNFFAKASSQYELISPQPIQVQLGATINKLPPTPPANRNDALAVMWWSLKLRWWAYKNTPDSISNTDRIRLYVIYHQEQQQALAHSLGLQKGMIGVIHAYANKKQSQQNQIVIAHEIMHTVGATDKYDVSNLPIYPMGYVEPQRSPLLPQRYAELMAGRRAITETTAQMPSSLRDVRVGITTATEVNWLP